MYGHCTLACLIKLFHNSPCIETLVISEPFLKRPSPEKTVVSDSLSSGEGSLGLRGESDEGSLLLTSIPCLH